MIFTMVTVDHFTQKEGVSSLAPRPPAKPGQGFRRRDSRDSPKKTVRQRCLAMHEGFHRVSGECSCGVRSICFCFPPKRWSCWITADTSDLKTRWQKQWWHWEGTWCWWMRGLATHELNRKTTEVCKTGNISQNCSNRIESTDLMR